MNIETLAIQSTQFHDANASAVVPPIYLSTTFEREADGSMPHGHIYTRASNPNRNSLEKAYAALEGGAVGMAFASGQAAASTIFQCLKPGDHVIIPDDAYYGTPALLEDVMRIWGLEYSKVDMGDVEAVARSFKPNTKLVWIETPSNPQLKIADIGAIADLARHNGAYSVCDNTWATPILQRPLDLGCDVSMHSATKYFGGHSDLLSGALIFKENSPLAEKARQIQALGGAVPSPFDCWLILRGIKTLPLRVRQQSANATQLAHFLSTHAGLEAVHYPTLESHLGYEVAQKQMLSGGGMLSIQVKGGAEEALRVKSKVKVFVRATSLGGVESLIEHRATAEGAHSVSPKNLLRISVGLEHIDDLIADLAQALS
ncbi:trans-sulfuration enzyme family protein [Runella zeae]|uniref:trans-sulfuration enzyme family protein n=1 Tax=Runella zeae TaxID=94255 RepID=UPI0003FE8F7E|nr:aminotransferase class I/II-fold pyridoxal phosphate-dependent enzyme [Runella zeae]